jgi:hypothetical protein
VDFSASGDINIKGISLPRRKRLIAAIAGVIAAMAIWGVPSAAPISHNNVRTPFLGPPGGHGWMSSRPKPRSIVWAVGDAADGTQAAQNVASMIGSRRVDRLLYLGDVYEYGTAQDFQDKYRPLYGELGNVTAPTIGNHEWPTAATGYIPYWTAVDGAPPPFWYAFAVSGWQVISLNSNLPASTAQRHWLDHLIRRSPRYGTCRIAFMHHAIFSAGVHGDLTELQPLFGELRGHARLVLAGHDHNMQRFRPVDGITQLVDGAGGSELYPANRDDRRLAFADDTRSGALRMELRPGRARITFIAADGSPLDRSAVRCAQ